jgi:D-3-phosphoglycerate dehydrogenase
MIMLSRKLYKAVESLKKGEWIKNQLIGWELRGKKVGIIGVGNIGSRVARLAYCFGMKPLLNDIIKLDEDFVRRINGEVVTVDELLRESDYVTLHVPLTKSTEKMIGERELKLMKKTAFLINTARGKLIDHDALYRALIEGWIAGAALDVYEVEPPIDLRLLRLENVICTPHIGAQTIEARGRASTKAIQLAVEYLRKLYSEK